MSVSERRNDHKSHPYTTTNTTAQHPISYHLSIEELPPTLEEEGSYGFRHSSPSADSLNEDDVIDEYAYEYGDEDPSGAGDVPWRPSVKEWLVIICVSIVVLMDAYDATVIVPLVPHLSHLFAKPLENILWLVTSYLLANAGGQVIFSMLADLFSQGSLLVTALVFVTAGTGVCGGSEAFRELLAGRVVQGMGGGGAMAISLLVVMDHIPSLHWARFVNWLFTVRVMGFILGPLLGGLFVDYAQFNYGFYFTFVFCGLAMLVAPFAVDLGVKKGASISNLRNLDWPGCLLNITGVGFLLAGLSWGGTEYQWDDWQTFMPIAVGAVLLLALTIWEMGWAARPFGLRTLKSRSMVSAYISSFLHGFVIFCQLQYLILYLTSTKYLTRFLAGLISIALTGQTLVTIFFVGQMGITKKTESFWIIRAGWTVTIVATGCCIILNKNTPTPGVIFMFFAAGIGHGLLIRGYNDYFTRATLQKHQEEEQEAHGATASSPIMIYSALRAWGMCFAVPVAGTILLTQLILQMKKSGLDTSNEYLIRLNEVLLSEGARDELEIVDDTGFRLIWQIVTVFAGIGGILSIFIKSQDHEQKNRLQYSRY